MADAPAKNTAPATSDENDMNQPAISPMGDDLGGPVAKVIWALLFLIIGGLMCTAMYSKYKRVEMASTDSTEITTGSGVEGAPAELSVRGQVPDFNLTAEDGKPFALQDLKGSVWVANFIFTRCAGTCLNIMQATSTLDKQLAALPDVKIVSFSMDPEFDQPEILANYAKSHNANKPGRWKFLTGNKDTMRKLTQEGFMLSMAEGKDPAEPVIHSSLVVLMDRRGQIRGTYSVLEPDGVMKLAAAVKKLEKSGE